MEGNNKENLPLAVPSTSTSSESIESFDSWTLIANYSIENDNSNSNLKKLSEKESTTSSLSKALPSNTDKDMANNENNKSTSGIEYVETEEQPAKINENDDLSDGISIISECESVDHTSTIIAQNNREQQNIERNDNNLKFEPITPPNTPNYEETLSTNNLNKDQSSQTSLPSTTIMRAKLYELDNNQRENELEEHEEFNMNDTLVETSNTTFCRFSMPISAKYILLATIIGLIAFLGNGVNQQIFQSVHKEVPELKQRVQNLELQSNLLRAEIDILSKHVHSQTLNQNQPNYERKNNKKYKMKNNQNEDKEYNKKVENKESIERKFNNNFNKHNNDEIKNKNDYNIKEETIINTNQQNFRDKTNEMKCNAEEKNNLNISNDLSCSENYENENDVKIEIKNENQENTKQFFSENLEKAAQSNKLNQNISDSIYITTNESYKEKYDHYKNLTEKEFTKEKKFKKNEFDYKNKFNESGNDGYFNRSKEFKKEFKEKKFDKKYEKDFKKKFYKYKDDDFNDDSKEYIEKKFDKKYEDGQRQKFHNDYNKENLNKKKKYEESKKDFKDSKKNKHDSEESFEKNDSKERYEKHHYDKTNHKNDKFKKLNNKFDNYYKSYENKQFDNDKNWHEKMMKHRENTRKVNEDKIKKDNNWYLQRGNGREEARVIEETKQNDNDYIEIVSGTW